MSLLAKVLITTAILVSAVGIQPVSATVTDCSNTFPIASHQASAAPSNIAPIAGMQVTNEGIWQNTRISVLGKVAVKTTQLRFDKVHGKATATIVWLDPKSVAFSQIGGTTDPVNNPKATGKIPASLKGCYLAGFHGGYLTKTKNHHVNDSQGGAMYNGYTALPMVDGKATLLTYTDGSIDIVNWPNWNHTKTIAQARQNISMIVKDRVSQVKSPELHNAWGWVWNGVGVNKNDVPRSGVGIRADGTVVWVLGNKLNATNLANLLVRAGSLRAMVLDMNKGYSNGYFYGPYHTAKTIGSKINPSMVGEPARFWQSSQRDFVAVFARSP